MRLSNHESAPSPLAPEQSPDPLPYFTFLTPLLYLRLLLTSGNKQTSGPEQPLGREGLPVRMAQTQQNQPLHHHEHPQPYIPTAPPSPPSPPTTTTTYDLDIRTSFAHCVSKLQSPSTGNFVVKFDDQIAECAIDLDARGILSWVAGTREENDDEGGEVERERDGNATGNGNQVVWVNFWADEVQRSIIEKVAGRYELSPRLAGLLCPSIGRPGGSGPSASSSSSSGGTPKLSSIQARGQGMDVEMGVHPQENPNHHGATTGTAGSGRGAAMSFGNVVRNLWHFCSVDFGRRYIYVGFNGLFSLPQQKIGNGSSSTSEQDKATSREAESRPAGVRIWSSLLICDDGTVISVFERPVEPEAHLITRRNVLNVFRHLSKVYFDDEKQDALMKVSVRWNGPSTTLSQSTIQRYDWREASSLLLYYLFDDWESTYKLIARVEHPYRKKLQKMRDLMFDAAAVEHVKQVHEIGRQLTVLKLMYQSYELIVARLLHSSRSARSRHMALSSLQNTMMDSGLNPGRDLSASQLAFQEDLPLDGGVESTVKLSGSAVVRFERLLDRIRLYALTEIEECIKEKEALVFMVGSRLGRRSL